MLSFVACRRESYVGIVVAFLGMSLAGCVTVSRLSGPVGEFRDATANTIASARPLLLDANGSERDRMEIKALATGHIPPEFASSRIPPEQIQVRLKTLELLQKYADGLKAIVDSTAVTEVRENSDKLQANLSSLGQAVVARGGPDFTGIAAPIGAAINLFGTVYLEQIRREAVRDAVVRAGPVVDSALESLDNEVTALQLLHSGAVHNRLVRMKIFYDTRAGGWDYASRRQAMADVRQLVNEAELLLINPPGDLVNDLRNAHKKMTEAVTNLNDPQSFADFIAAVGEFAARAKDVRQLYDTVHHVPSAVDH